MGSTNLVGRAVDRYDVGEQLGQGGFGVVYRARHRILGTEVALKVLWPDRADVEKNVERFLQEARAAAAIGSPHIVAVSDAGRTADGIVYIAMELLEGCDLAEELHRRKTLPIEEAAHIVCMILEGLSAAHQSGVIHRDLKPGNVFLTLDEQGVQNAKLLDFGISKVLGAKELTAEGMMLGTPHYMSPEQISASPTLDHRADVFSVGCILYKLITGQVPIEGEAYEVMVQRVHGVRPPDIRTKAPQLSDALADVVMRSLAVDPDARWQSATEMQQALRTAVHGQDQIAGSAPSSSTVVLEPDARSASPVLTPGASPPSTRTPSNPPTSRSAPSSRPSMRPSSRPSMPSSRPSMRPMSEAPSSPAARTIPLIGVAMLATLLAAALGVFSVLTYRLYGRSSTPEPTPPATNPIPVQLEPRPTARAVPVPVPIPTPGPLPIEEPRVWFTYHGTGQREAVEELIARAVPELHRCATDRPLHLVLSVSIRGASIGIATPHPNRRSDDRDAAECAAQIIREASPVDFGPQQSAMMDVDIELPAY